MMQTKRKMQKYQSWIPLKGPNKDTKRFYHMTQTFHAKTTTIEVVVFRSSSKWPTRSANDDEECCTIFPISLWSIDLCLKLRDVAIRRHCTLRAFHKRSPPKRTPSNINRTAVNKCIWWYNSHHIYYMFAMGAACRKLIDSNGLRLDTIVSSFPDILRWCV